MLSESINHFKGVRSIFVAFNLFSMDTPDCGKGSVTYFEGYFGIIIFIINIGTAFCKIILDLVCLLGILSLKNNALLLSCLYIN